MRNTKQNIPSNATTESFVPFAHYTWQVWKLVIYVNGGGS